MRCLQRNKQTFQYKNYVSDTDVQVDGLYTGDREIVYSTPVTCQASISPASGYSQTEQFGVLDGYDKVIETHENLPVTETSKIIIDGEEYIVRRIAKSLNYMAIAIKKC